MFYNELLNVERTTFKQKSKLVVDGGNRTVQLDIEGTVQHIIIGNRSVQNTRRNKNLNVFHVVLKLLQK